MTAGSLTTADAGATTATTTSSSSTTTGSASDALEALRQYLAIARAERPEFASQDFANTPLSAADAKTAGELIWGDHAELIAEERQAEAEAKAITIGEHTLRYDFTAFGDEPETGHSLYISLHGGGEADASVNDEQWDNQKVLYEPAEGIYLAPRAPTNTWNLWHEPHIDVLLQRLIENFIVIEGVDPNHVYVMGYSAGGDGVYQLGPRMADSWAAAAMMAGHPNDAKPDSLRNLGFTIHVGALDTAFDRNLVAAEWGALLDDLEAMDPGGYPHYVEVHPDKPHWMDLEDAVAVPWMAEFTRNPTPARVVWLQDDVTHSRFYWLSVDAANAVGGARIEATVTGQTIDIESSGVKRLTLRLSDALLDLDQPIRVASGNTSLYEGTLERTMLTLWTTLLERGDPALVFSSEVAVDLE
ncbi:MAG TPA: hypothetical protein VFU02_21035 [Polyangiaceae bacterium]|nr:hypothetical protein [Polyangiaceae bacterium]